MKLNKKRINKKGSFLSWGLGAIVPFIGLVTVICVFVLILTLFPANSKKIEVQVSNSALTDAYAFNNYQRSKIDTKSNLGVYNNNGEIVNGEDIIILYIASNNQQQKSELLNSIKKTAESYKSGLGAESTRYLSDLSQYDLG